MRDAFEKGEDIHARTALELFGEVNRDTRGRAKTINFSILYGISRWGLSKRLESTADEAQCVAELDAADKDTVAAGKSQLALGAQRLFETATRAHESAVHALTTLRERTAPANAPDNEDSVRPNEATADDSVGSIRTHDTTATPRST